MFVHFITKHIRIIFEDFTIREKPYVEDLLANHMQGTKIIDESQDQDTTDLHKCVACIRDLLSLEHPNVS